MKLGTQFPQKWKEKSIKDNILLSDILYGYILENLMYRIQKSSFREWLWLANEDVLGEDAYRKTIKERVEFCYIEKEKKTAPLSMQVAKAFIEEVILNKEDISSEIRWEYSIREEERKIILFLTGTYLDMQVPVHVSISAMKYEKQIPKEKVMHLMFEEKKVFHILTYSKENLLSEAVFEIMRKLELISDMKAYSQVNDILKSQSVSGRRILDELKIMGENEPKVVSMKRFEMLSTYTNYGYMKKRWQQYARKHTDNADEWEIVMKRLLTFIGPLWTALCDNEIFFDDWMPELERFLG